MHTGSKNSFNDGIYKTKRFYGSKVYVLRVDEDTIAVFPVLDFPDSTAILVKQRVNYTSLERKMKDNRSSYSFYKPSFDVDLMTVPLKYRPANYMLPNTLTANFNGAIYGGYRIDAYKLNYKRTPLNVYKESVKHTGYSAGLFAGIGSALIDDYSITSPAINTQYEGVLLITGVAVNVAVENLTLGLSFGTDHLLDKYHSYWVYEGKPCVGFTVGLNLK